ncbi:MAG: proteasome subunit beta [archaeon]
MEEELKKHVSKTGTTTLGIVCKDGIVIAADKRVTYGGEGGVSYIASADAEKIVHVNEKMIVTTAGNVSDVQKIIRIIKAELKLKELRSRVKTSVQEAANLFSNMVYHNIRQFSNILGVTHFLLGGYDQNGFLLYEISADGALKQITKYCATGSGMINCNPILDSEYKPNLSMQEGIKLALKCINSSMKRDPASGEGIDVYTIKKDSINQEIQQKVEMKFVDVKNSD